MAKNDSSLGGTHSGENTIIGPSILISGKLSGDEDLIVRGRVEGEVALERTLIVENSGVVKANVDVRNAVVSGVVVGNISAQESVELTKDGRMVGDIRAPRVIIVDGASFRGRVDMGDLPARPAGERRPATVRPAVRSSAPAARSASSASAAVPAKKGMKPLPPPAPPSKGPVVPVVAAGAKKKVIIKKKG
ncbi:MAG: polymer-forming cytoskeletal protein [Myxococcaceae bacterium]